MRSVSLFARPTIRLALAAVFTMIAPLVAAPQAAAEPATVATEPSTLQCASSAPIYSVRANGDLGLYQHQEPETGLFSWAPARQIDTRWLGANSFAGPNGVIYSAVDDGRLLRRRWNGTGWDTFAGGAQFEVIDTGGWERYTRPEYRHYITADTEGHIYTVEADNYLHWRSYDAASRTWTHRTVARPNRGFPTLVGGGSGVLYLNSVLPRPGTFNTALERYRYHATSQRLVLTNASFSFDGTRGWGEFKQIFSVGGDIVYGVRSDNGDLMWMRFNEDTDTWAEGGSFPGKRLDGNWQNEFDVFAAPDSCRRMGGSAPVRPQVAPQPHAPVTLLRSSNGHVHYTYVDSEGRAVHAEAADLTGSPIGAAVVPGFTGVTGITSTAENQNGRVHLVARGLDAEVRGNTQTAVSGPWEGTTTLGGFVSSPATSFTASGRIGILATDQTGGLWHRQQFEVNGPMQAWRRLGSSPLANGPITAATVPNTSTVRIVGLDRTGGFSTATFSMADSGSVSPWTSLGGTGFHAAISAVVMPDNKLQVFATGTDGVVRTQRESSTGFPGTWTTIPGVTASGAPSAVMAPDGRLQVVVRAADGYVYFAGQAAPGAGFEPWREITNFSEQSSTDPTALAVPEAGTWVVAYRNEIDAPKLRRYQPGSLVAGADLFVDVPMVLGWR